VDPTEPCNRKGRLALARSCPTETLLGDQRRQPPQPESGKCRRRHPARHRPRPLRRLPGSAQDRARHRPGGGADVLTRRSPTAPTGWRAPWMPPAGARSFAIDDAQPTASPWQPLCRWHRRLCTGNRRSFRWVGSSRRRRARPAPWSPSQRFRPVDGSLSSAPRRIELGTLGSALRPSVHSRASEKPVCRCAAMLAFGWVLRAVSAGVLTGMGKFKLGRPGWRHWLARMPWAASLAVSATRLARVGGVWQR
jgi:hypothetical protein